MADDIETASTGGLTAPITDSPPPGAYTVPSAPFFGKAKIALAVLGLALAGVVAGVVLSSTSGAEPSDGQVPVLEVAEPADPTDSPVASGPIPSLAPTDWSSYAPTDSPLPDVPKETESPSVPFTKEPTPWPSPWPSTSPTPEPTPKPTAEPTSSPSPYPTKRPSTPRPTRCPTRWKWQSNDC